MRDHGIHAIHFVEFRVEICGVLFGEGLVLQRMCKVARLCGASLIILVEHIVSLRRKGDNSIASIAMENLDLVYVAGTLYPHRLTYTSKFPRSAKTVYIIPHHNPPASLQPISVAAALCTRTTLHTRHKHKCEPSIDKCRYGRGLFLPFAGIRSLAL